MALLQIFWSIQEENIFVTGFSSSTQDFSSKNVDMELDFLQKKCLIKIMKYLLFLLCYRVLYVNHPFHKDHWGSPFIIHS